MEIQPAESTESSIENSAINGTEDSIKNDLSAAFDKIAEPEKSEPSTSRDESGRFAKKEEKPLETEPKIEAIEPPQHWSEQDKATFKNSPKEIQEWALRRHKEMEADHTRKTQEIASFRKTKEALDEVLAPHRQSYQLQGFDDVTAIRQLLSAQDFLAKDPANAIAWLAKTYGVDMNNLPQTMEVDPHIAQLQAQIKEMEGRLNETTTQKQQEVTQQLQQQIDAFANEKDEKGLKYPHFQEVRQDMALLIQAQRAQDLPTAYEMAVWANPKTREQLMATQQKAAAEKAEIDRKRKADEAKKASFAVTGSTPGVKQASGAKTVRESLESAFDAFN